MLSVLMATHNGAQTLPDVLDAYCHLRPPDGGWKLVIVNNASTDATSDIISSFSRRLPLVCLFEPRRGQNCSRNTGLSAIAGELVVFTDDDAVPHPDWLVQIHSSADAQPGFSIFGGAIAPRWEAAPDERLLRWVPLAPCFAITDPAWEEGPIKSDFVFSPNMAIRADVFSAGYRFDETIGPGQGEYAMGSETELTRRLARAGARAWHCKRAVVEHFIRSHQLTADWLLGRAVRYGRGQYRVAFPDRERPPQFLLSVPRHLVRPFLAAAVRLALATLRGDSESQCIRRWDLKYLIGYAREARFQRRPPASSTRVSPLAPEVGARDPCSVMRHEREH